MGTPKVSSCQGSNYVRPLTGLGEVRSRIPAPVYATNNFCFAFLASGVLDRGPYPFPVQWVHVWDPPLVPSYGS